MRALSGASLALVAMLALGSSASVGCAKVGEVKAKKKRSRRPMRRTRQQDYKKAAELYEETRCKADPNLTPGLLLPRQQLRQPVQAEQEGRAGQRRAARQGGRELPARAEKLARRRPIRTKEAGKLSLEYLVGGLRADKLNDPAQAEPVVQRMIQLDPGEPANYFALAKIYEDAGAYDRGRRDAAEGEEAKPNDPAVYMTLAGFYNRQGQFDKTIEALEERAAEGAEQPGGLLHDRRPTTGTRPTATSS